MEKKILIVEDEDYYLIQIQKALKGLGELMVCKEGKNMPTKSRVLRLIKKADLILLDYKLHASYTGEDLLPFCKNKKVIGISSTYPFTIIDFAGKINLDKKSVREKLRKLALEVLEKK